MANNLGARIRVVNNNNDTALEAVRTFWNEHVDDWKVARNEPGSAEFFREIEDYRFEKLHYLPRVVNYAGYAGQSVLDVGCGVGNDTSRFARGGAHVTGIDLAPRSIELATRNFQQREFGWRVSCDGRRAPRLPRRSLRPRLLPYGAAVHAASRPNARRDPPRAEAGQTRDYHGNQSTLLDAGHTENREGGCRLLRRARLQTIHDRRVSQDARNVFFGQNSGRTVPREDEDSSGSQGCSVQPCLRRHVQPVAKRPWFGAPGITSWRSATSGPPPVLGAGNPTSTSAPPSDGAP